ncbi:unnamed protein product [Tetraodon nigroviridis]|uniref:Chromosome 12 SCAF15007, whole genome shotgun sequence n=1 Tax=Tetraodon nigroviridis TaxID=99883 RepID=Q4RPS0_TETNG|nr:unnamed protein product [Tetraodon nigroviridis]
MSDTLCKWLNKELSQAIEPKALDKNFSNGYLFGELLFKYQLQKDFTMFTNNDTSVSKLNNFTRLEPTLHLLGIPFDTNKAQAIMQEKQGVATHLLYQLYVSLGEKKKGQTRENVQPTAKTCLHKEEHDIPSDGVCVTYECEKRQELNTRSVVIPPIINPPQQKRQPKVHNILEMKHTEKDWDVSEKGAKLILQSNDKYIRDIQKRLHENLVAREQREKRLQRFTMEQIKAREAQEEARRDEQLVRRLTRQTQQEQRLAAQLLQIRRQKDVILENRLFREEQYRQRREKDFQEALEREAALASQAKLDHAEEMKKEIEMCQKITAERSQNKYDKHFAICKDIMGQMVDFATKVEEYRQLTGNLIPQKQTRGWKEFLLKGLPLYQSNHVQTPEFDLCTPLDPVEQQKQDILNDLDYEEYTNMEFMSSQPIHLLRRHWQLIRVERMRAFQRTWPKLEKWFDKKQNILVRVDADVDEEELYQRLECVLQPAMMQTPEGTNTCEDVPGGETGTGSPSPSTWEYVDDPLPPELCERLRDISNKRKTEDEKEMDAVMGDGFLEDHTVLLINQHSVLMQLLHDKLISNYEEALAAINNLLLVVLQRFRSTDAEHTGYINETEYSQLDYVSMLQYLAAHPNPTQGFTRALSVVLGQPIKHVSSSHLVKHPFIQSLVENSTQHQLVVGL